MSHRPEGGALRGGPRTLLKPRQKGGTAMTEAMLTPWGEALDREHPLPEYPRPQLRRNSYLNLNGIWEYAITKTAEKPAAMQGEIVVPFSPETPLSGVGHILQPDEYLWYRRSVTLPEGFFQGGRLLLHFGAVDQCCTVWVNGQEAGSHTGGYLPFALDVTELIEGDAFTLELRVTDPTDTGSLSRGKQRLKNTGIWYTPQSGIWQTVWMECVPENYLRSLSRFAGMGASLPKGKPTKMERARLPSRRRNCACGARRIRSSTMLPSPWRAAIKWRATLGCGPSALGRTKRGCRGCC